MPRGIYARKRIHAQRITHCPQGHPYDEANTYVNPNTGHRLCRTCNRAAGRAERKARFAPEDVREDLAYTAWMESQDHELPCGCMASQPRHTCEDDPDLDDDNPHEE